MNRYRLGLIVPSSNTVMEQEFREILPIEISVHTARIQLRHVVVTELLEMEQQIRGEASKLADANVDVIGFGCTSGSFVRGKSYDRQIVNAIQRVAGKPAVATAGAIVDALRSLGLSTISVATPYTDLINDLERKFLEQNGFSIVKMAGLGLTDNLEIGKLKPTTVFNLIKRVSLPKAEGVFASCTNMPTINAIADLEKTLKKPVVSSNTATLWAMLRKIGHPLQIRNYGRLFHMV